MPELIVGVMTGNSLDAADAVLTAFYPDGRMEDRAFVSVPFPPSLASDMRNLRACVQACNGEMQYASAAFPDFDRVVAKYMTLVEEAVRLLMTQSGHAAKDITAIGLHGQTCAHNPPFYTVQIADGQYLADRTGIPVVYDFRSDDVMGGGQGAPFAPKHNERLAYALWGEDHAPVTFVNGGNTSNLAHVTWDAHSRRITAGWDAGPCNHFPDYLSRTYAGQPCDTNGAIGAGGAVHGGLLKELFEGAAVLPEGGNFLTLPAPKSSDPQWYVTVPGLQDAGIPLADRMRTAEYFAAYALYHSLGHTPEDMVLPSRFIVFGGGWKNPVVKEAFTQLVQGAMDACPILPEHEEHFGRIRSRMQGERTVEWADSLGFHAQATEARIFADMAWCYLHNIPFTSPHTTGIAVPVRCGIIAHPQQPSASALRWSRAASGWAHNIQKVG